MLLLFFIACNTKCCLCPGKYCDMAFEVRLLVFQFRGGLVRICKGVKKMVEDNIQRGQDVKISPSLPRFAGGAVKSFTAHTGHTYLQITLCYEQLSILTSNILHM